jgi:hypothetical protein
MLCRLVEIVSGNLAASIFKEEKETSTISLNIPSNVLFTNRPLICCSSFYWLPQIWDICMV